MPTLKITRQTIGTISIKKQRLNVMPSIMQKIKKTMRVRQKFIRADTFLEKRKRYFGTFTFVKIEEFASNELMPPFVESEKKEKTILPQNR